MFSVTKDPKADLDYSIDWTQWLGPNQKIFSSDWAIPPASGLRSHTVGIDTTGTVATLWLTGGIVGAWSITNKITTNSVPPRTDERTITVTVAYR